MRTYPTKTGRRATKMRSDNKVGVPMSHPEYRARQNLIKRYGITLENYEAMLEAQDGGCYICGNPPNAKRLHVDHCHETGAVRGLLCAGCNRTLGWLEAYGDKIREYLKGR
jgi:hypothetical protein